ncbi:MAG: hypothetical protein ACD_75C02281G0001, partial [uncultured bacterium]
MEFPVLTAQQISAAIQKRLAEKSSATRLVCFDFFDTLVSRSVVPEDTKKIAAGQLAELLGEGLTGELIYQLRRVLEQRLCAESHRNGLDPEFNLLDLGRVLYGVLKEITGDGLLPAEGSFVALLTDIEVAVEKLVQTVNREVVELLRDCRSRGMKTAIVSDFYLPSEYFRQLLSCHGLSGLVDHLFISADFRLTKGHDGRLYEVVCRESGYRPEETIMVGDSGHADDMMARRRGISAYCLRQPEKSTESGVNVTQGRADREPERIYTELFAGNRACHFPEMGLSLHYFTHKLFLQAVSDRHDTLFFCSKEGEFLRKLFMRYQEIRFGRQVVASRYLMVSRKATYICSCKKLEDEDFGRLFVHYRDLSLLEFLRSLNFSKGESLALCEKLQLEPATRHYDLKNHPDFQSLIGSESFRASYEVHRLSQRENFLLYLNSHGRGLEEEGLTLVDVGWKGSIQNNIYYALDGRVKVSGYYLGLLSPTELHPNNGKKGILFSDYPSHSPFVHVFNNNRSLFEMVLGASHGSADGYFRRDQWENLLYPRQSDFYQNDEGEHPFVTVMDLPEERRLFNELIAPLQNVYGELNDRLAAQLVSLTPAMPEFEWWARQHARMVFRPTRDEIDFYAGLYHLENFGLFEFTAFRPGGKLPVSTRLGNLLALLKDPAGHLETGV